MIKINVCANVLFVTTTDTTICTTASENKWKIHDYIEYSRLILIETNVLGELQARFSYLVLTTNQLIMTVITLFCD